MIGVLGWAILVGLLLAWEGLSMALDRPDWPSLSDMFRAVTRPVVGRWLLFAAWLWLGWHLFMRGWSFFLADRGAHAPPRSSKSGGQLLRQVVLPLLASFAGWLALVAAGRRERARRAEEEPSGRVVLSAPRRWRQLAITVAGGYVAFVSVIAVYAAASGQLASGLVSAAVRQGAFLAFAVTIPVFAFVGAAEAAWRSHHPGRNRR